MKDDLISRSALTERIVDLLVFEWGYEGIEESVRQIFSEIPAVDEETVIKSLPYVKEALEMAKQNLAPVRHGEWHIFRDECVLLAECSECGTVQSGIAAAQWDYCPMCGCRMDGGGDDDQA
jgi:hypothetical protein